MPTKSPRPTHIDLAPATSLARSPDDDITTAYDGPLDPGPTGMLERLTADAERDVDGDGDVQMDGGAGLEYESDDAEGVQPSPERQAKLDKARAAGLLVPRGILKNAPGRVDALGRQVPAGDHLTWDEGNIALTEIQKDSLMKIDEPKTPFVKHDQLGDIGDVPDFELAGGASPASSSRGREPQSPGGRSRSSDAALVAANTRHNANLGSLPQGEQPMSPAVPSPPLGAAAGGVQRSRTPSQSGSRSASFNLPDARGGHIVRRPSSGAGSLQGVGGGADEVVEEDEDADEANMDPETLKKHREFKQRRKGHYSNEADAMRMAQALIAKEADEDEE